MLATSLYTRIRYRKRNSRSFLYLIGNDILMRLPYLQIPFFISPLGPKESKHAGSRLITLLKRLVPFQMVWVSPKRIQTLHEVKHAASSRGANPEEESSGRASFGDIRSRPYAVAPPVHVRQMPFAPTPRPIEEGSGRTRRSAPPIPGTRGANAIRPYPTNDGE